MATYDADYIQDMQVGPPNTDPIAEGAAAIEETKRVLINQFPNFSNGEVLQSTPSAIDSLVAGSGIPPGLIALWSGTEDNVPNGWLFCDGTGGTPDLRGRMLLGASNAAFIPAGATGGSGSIDKTIESDGHALTVPELPAHSHPITVGPDTSSDSHSETNRVARGQPGTTANGVTENTGGSQAHTHDVQLTLSLDEKYPLYYALAYIMKA